MDHTLFYALKLELYVIQGTYLHTHTHIYIYIYIYIYIILFNSAAPYVEQSTWGTKARAGQSKTGEKTEALCWLTSSNNQHDAT